MTMPQVTSFVLYAVGLCALWAFLYYLSNTEGVSQRLAAFRATGLLVVAIATWLALHVLHLSDSVVAAIIVVVPLLMVALRRISAR